MNGMKVEVQNGHEDIEYPKLFISDAGSILLATGTGTGILSYETFSGVILQPGGGVRGAYGDSFKKSNWKPFNGSVTLSNG